MWERGDKTNQGIPELNASSVGMAKVRRLFCFLHIDLKWCSVKCLIASLWPCLKTPFQIYKPLLFQ